MKYLLVIVLLFWVDVDIFVFVVVTILDGLLNVVVLLVVGVFLVDRVGRRVEVDIDVLLGRVVVKTLVLKAAWIYFQSFKK